MTYQDPTDFITSGTNYVTTHVGSTEGMSHVIVGGKDYIVINGSATTEFWEIDPATGEFVGTTPTQTLSLSGGAGNSNQDLETFTATDSNGIEQTFLLSDNASLGVTILKYDLNTGDWVDTSMSEADLGQSSAGGPSFGYYKSDDGNLYGYTRDDLGDVEKMVMNADTGKWEPALDGSGVPITITTTQMGSANASMWDDAIVLETNDGPKLIINTNNTAQAAEGIQIFDIDPATGDIIPGSGSPLLNYNDEFSDVNENEYLMQSVKTDPDGNIVFGGGAINEGFVMVYDPSTNTILYEDQNLNNSIDKNPTYTYSPDGRYMYITSSEGAWNGDGATTTVVIDRQTWTEVDNGRDDTDNIMEGHSTIVNEGSYVQQFFTLSSGKVIYVQQNWNTSNSNTGWMTIGTPTGDNAPVCFVAGTLIRTNRGEIAIENLQVGDMVETLDHGMQAIRWIGSSVKKAEGALAPILFRAGSIGNARDLRVSPQHRMLVTGWKAEILFGEETVLVAAKGMLNDSSIIRVEGGEVEYFHMLFDNHEIVFAEGALSESFHPGVEALNGITSEQTEEIFAIFPELREKETSYGPAAYPSLKLHEAKLLNENSDVFIA